MNLSNYQNLITILYGKYYILNSDLKTITHTKENIKLSFDLSSVELKEEMISWITINNFEILISNTFVRITSEKYYIFKHKDFKGKSLIDNIISSIVYIHGKLIEYKSQKINNLKILADNIFFINSDNNIRMEEKENDIKVYKKEDEFNFDPYTNLEQFDRYILHNQSMSKYSLVKKNDIYELTFKNMTYKSNNFQDVFIIALLKGTFQNDK